MSATTETRRTLPKLPRRESNAVPRSQMERLWLVSGGLIAFVMLLVGYFFFISPQRSSTADVNSQAATVRQQNVALQARLDALSEENKNLPQVEAQLAQLHEALPSTSGVSDFLRTLQSLGSATLTDVTALTVGQPAAVTLAPVAPTAAAPTTAANSSAPVVASAAPPGLFGMPITATVTGSPTALTKFLDQLQAVQPRAVLITDISLTGGDQAGGEAGSGSNFALNLTMQAFVAPASSADSAALSASATPNN